MDIIVLGKIKNWKRKRKSSLLSINFYSIIFMFMAVMEMMKDARLSIMYLDIRKDNNLEQQGNSVFNLYEKLSMIY